MAAGRSGGWHLGTIPVEVPYWRLCASRACLRPRSFWLRRALAASVKTGSAVHRTRRILPISARG
eukprot:861875-Lingulodinium_polyedra.AAC.1